jgi:hypothetical protein
VVAIGHIRKYLINKPMPAKKITMFLKPLKKPGRAKKKS